MARNNKKSENNSTSPVVEGEILDGPSNSENTNNQPDAKPKSSKTLWLLAFVMVFILGGWWALPTIKDSFNGVYQQLVGGDGDEVVPEPVSEPASVAFDAEAEINNIIAQITQLEARLNNRLGTQDLQLSDMGQRVAALEVAIGNIAARETIDTEPVVESGVDQEMLSRIERLEQAQQQMVGVGGTDNVSGNSEILQRLERLEAMDTVAPEVTAAPQEAEYFMSLVHLSRAVSTGGSYETQLMELQALYQSRAVLGNASQNQYLESLNQWSSKGVPTDKQIVEAFRNAVPLALAAEAETLDLPWWTRLWNSIRGLVVVRKTGELEGESIEALLARAEIRIERGNHREAHTILLGTTLAEQDAMAELIQMLDARDQAQNAVTALITQGLQAEPQ